MPKKIIKTENNLDFELIGVITSKKDYTLAWFLNEILNFKFSKVTSEFYVKDFSLYACDFNNKSIVLIENKSNEGVFLPELKKFDFIIKLPDSDFYEKNIKNKLTSTPDYVFSGILNKSKLTKRTKNIISEIEI